MGGHAPLVSQCARPGRAVALRTPVAKNRGVSEGRGVEVASSELRRLGREEKILILGQHPN